MGNYYLLRDGLITDSSKYGISVPGSEKINNTDTYTLTTSDSWSTALTGASGDVIDSIAVHLSSRAATPVGTLILSVSSRTVSPTVVGTYPVSSFTSFDGSNNTVATYPLNWQLLKLSSPFTNNTGTFKLNLKTSDVNQLTLMGVNTVNGVDYDRMAVLSGDTAFGSLIKTNVTLDTDSPFGVGTDSSMSFNGSTSYARVPGSSDLDFGTGNFTIEFWIKVPVTGNAHADRILTFGEGSNSTTISFILGNTDNGSGYLSVVTGFYLNNNKTVTVNNNQWRHIALTRSGVSTVRLFIDGSQVGVDTTSVENFSNGRTYGLRLGSWTNSSNFTNCKISNLRITKGVSLYDTNFTPLGAPFDLISSPNLTKSCSLFKAPYDNYIFNTTTDKMHVGGIIDGNSTQNRTITAATVTLGDLYVHKNGLFKFPNTSTTLTVVGADALQATSEGTIQVGSSTTPVPNNTTHEIILSGNHIGVSNGGRLDVYGAYKVPHTKFTQNYDALVNNFNTAEDITSWKINDTVVLLPNTTSSNTTEIFTINSFSNSNNFAINTFTTGFPHPVLSYVPNVANLTRNVKIGGASNSAKGNIQTKDGAFVNINNTEFKFIDGSLKTGLSSNGLFSLSGCTLSGNGTETLLTYPVSSSGKISINSSIINNVIFKAQYGINLDGVTSSNNTITNNLILSSKDAGIFIKNGLKGSLNFNNNISIGPSPYGSFVQNNTAGITLSSIINCNNTKGMMVSSAHTGNIDNIINTYNSVNGVHVDGAISQLNQTTFTNITASNNRTVGFLVSGNAINHLAPVILNINHLVANDNLSGGFEGYCIAGNLSSVELNRNGFYGMKTSIGNYNTTIDGITALMNNVATTSAAIGILSGICYYPILIKDANVGKSVSSSTFGAGISLDSTKFSEFSVNNSTVSGGSSDFQLRTTKNILEGSYLISNTNVGVLPVGVGISTTNYQSDVLKTTGFAFTNMNNITGYHVTYLAAGNRSIDSTTTCNINETTSPSERLTPQSTSLKLRSGSKFVALSSGESTAIAVYVRKSTLATNGVAYNGTAPRLILKRNGAMGINSDILMDQLDTTSENFLKLSGVTPIVTDVGVLEFYVDCDGTQGWINIDNWTAN